MNIVRDKNNKRILSKVKPRDFLYIGLDPAAVWNVDIDKEIDINIFIVATFINSYSERVIHKLLEYFGQDIIIYSLDKYKNRVSDKLYNSVITYIDKHQFI